MSLGAPYNTTRAPDWVWPHHPGHRTPSGNGNADIKTTSVDVPDPFESFLLQDGEKKVEMKVDTRTPNTCIFLFNKEDHTLGNLLGKGLLRNPRVLFSGYKVPHPLNPSFELRVQTDGDITPKEAVLSTCRDAVKDLDIISREFTKEFELRKMVTGGQGGGQMQHDH